MLNVLIKIEVGVRCPNGVNTVGARVSTAHLCNFRVEEGCPSMRLLVQLRCYQGERRLGLVPFDS